MAKAQHQDGSHGLGSLPAEVSFHAFPETGPNFEQLIQQIHLHALNPYFPQVNRYIYDIISSAPSYYIANYLLDLYSPYGHNDILVRALRHPICGVQVAKDIERIWDRRRTHGIARHQRRVSQHQPEPPNVSPTKYPSLKCPELPRRLFRKSRSSGTKIDPLLTYLFETYKPSPNSHKGYPLCRAVLTSDIPLVIFLLSKGADPSIKEDLAVQIAISKRSLEMVKLLVERSDDDSASSARRSAEKDSLRKDEQDCKQPKTATTQYPKHNKKLKLSDRVLIDSRMVQLAMESGDKDIVRYFVHDKGAYPP